MIQLRRTDQAEPALATRDVIVRLELQILVDGGGRVGVEPHVLAVLREGKENIGAFWSRVVRLHQRHDGLIRVACLRVDGCEVEEAIGIVGALPEGGLVDLPGAIEMAGVLRREPEVIEDVKVCGSGAQGAREGFLGVRITPPTHINHSDREVNARIVAGVALNFLEKGLRRAVLVVPMQRLDPQERGGDRFTLLLG